MGVGGGMGDQRGYRVVKGETGESEEAQGGQRRARDIGGGMGGVREGWDIRDATGGSEMGQGDWRRDRRVRVRTEALGEESEHPWEPTPHSPSASCGPWPPPPS